MRQGLLMTVGALLVGLAASLCAVSPAAPDRPKRRDDPLVSPVPRTHSTLPIPSPTKASEGTATEVGVASAPAAGCVEDVTRGTDRAGEVEAAFQRALGHPEEADAVRVLRLRMCDQDVDVRCRALEALATLGDEEGVCAWEAALGRDADVRVRARLVGSVPEERGGDPCVRETRLRLATTDAADPVRRAAMEGWSGDLSPEEAERILSALERERDASTRRAMIEALSTWAPSHDGVAQACLRLASDLREPRDVRSAGLAGLRLANAFRPGAFDSTHLDDLERQVLGQ